MAATNYPKLVYAKIWTLLLAHTPFTTTYREGNRIRFDGTARDPMKESLGEGDLPQATLFPGTMQVGAFTDTPHYAHKIAHNPLTANDWAETWLLNYRLELIHRTLEIGESTLQLMEVMTALRKGNPKMGLTYVRRWGPLTLSAPAFGAAAEYGEDVWVHNINIPVELFINGSSLVT